MCVCELWIVHGGCAKTMRCGFLCEPVGVEETVDVDTNKNLCFFFFADFGDLFLMPFFVSLLMPFFCFFMKA